MGHTRRSMLGRRVASIALLCQLIVVAAAMVGSPTHAAATGHPAGGINAEPAMRPALYAGPNPDGWWCQPPNCYQAATPRGTIDQELTLAARLHVANVRIEFPWALMQPQPDMFDWSRADLIVAEARAHHVTLQPVLMWTPSWENSAPSQVTAGEDFESFVKAFTKRYDHAFSVIEMWNEPDGGAYGSYTHGREQVYVDTILNPGYAAVKSVDASIAVELGGSINDSGGCCPFLRAVISGGGRFDIAAFHNYIGARSAIAEAQAYREVLDGMGRSGTPIWLGEYGVPDASAGDTSHQLLMQTILGGNSDLAMAQWYNLRDDFAMTCCPPDVVVAGHWGLVQHDDCTVKAGYASMAALLGGDPSQPPCASAASGGAASPSGTPPGGSAGRVAAGSGGSAGVLPWAIVAVGAAVAAAVVAGLLAIRHRGRLRRRTQTGRSADDGW